MNKVEYLPVPDRYLQGWYVWNSQDKEILSLYTIGNAHPAAIIAKNVDDEQTANRIIRGLHQHDN
jgi:hypothetical protein